jgi:hypothetical protein
MTSRSSVEKFIERARSQARIAAIVTTAITSVARAKVPAVAQPRHRVHRRHAAQRRDRRERGVQLAHGGDRDREHQREDQRRALLEQRRHDQRRERQRHGELESPRMLTSPSVTVITATVSSVNIASIALSR